MALCYVPAQRLVDVTATADAVESAPQVKHRNVRANLLPKQRELATSIMPEVLYSGALGAGKSIAGCYKILALAQRYPGTTHAIVRKKLVTLRKTTLETFFKEVCPREFIVHWNKSELRCTVKAGRDGKQTSDILFIGMVTDRGEAFNVRSLTLGSAFYDEVVEAEEAEWDELGNRLRDPKCGVHQLIGATNPGSRGHWVYQRMFVNADPKAHHVIQATTLENPYLPPDYLTRINRLKGRYYDRFVLGKWVGFEGLVYDVYDPTVHSISWAQFRERWGVDRIPDEWVRVRSIDFGFANPFVCQWWAISPDGEWYRYREIYYSRRLVEHHARDIRALTRKDYPEAEDDEQVPRLPTYADHDAEDRATLHYHGVQTVRARKEVSQGIQAVYQKLSLDPVTGRPGMFFIRDVLVDEDPVLVHGEPKKPCCTEEELQTYHYPKGSTAKNPKEGPVDVDNHGCDATRYAYWSHERMARAAMPGIRRDIVRRDIVRRDIVR